MPVITFANTKGGAGKTTAVLLLSTELARLGYKVSVLDTDPQRWITRWHETGGAPANLDVVAYVTAATMQREIRDRKQTDDYIIIDLPGASSPLLATAIGMSNHIMIPIQGCAMDAKGGAQVLELLRYLDDRAAIRIDHSVVMTRVNSMVTTRALQAVKALLAERRVRVLDTPIIERAAYRDIFDYGGTLETLDPERVSNLDKARENAALFAAEVMRLVPASENRRLASVTPQLIRNAA